MNLILLAVFPFTHTFGSSSFLSSSNALHLARLFSSSSFFSFFPLHNHECLRSPPRLALTAPETPARGATRVVPALPISHRISPTRPSLPPSPAPATIPSPSPALFPASARLASPVSTSTQFLLPSTLLSSGPAPDASYHPPSLLPDPVLSHRSHPCNGKPAASISLRPSTSRALTHSLGSSPTSASGVLPSSSVQFGSSVTPYPPTPPPPTSCTDQIGYARFRYATLHTAYSGHPLITPLISAHPSHCGICTPFFLMPIQTAVL